MGGNKASRAAPAEEPLDEFFMKTYQENFGIWITAGGLHPGPTKYWWVPLLGLSTTFLLGLLLIPTICKSLFTSPSVAYEAIHFVMFLSIEFTIVFSFYTQKDKVTFIYRTLGMGFYDYQGTLDDGTLVEAAELSASSRRQKRVLGRYFSWVIFGAYGSITYVRPVIKFYQEEHLAGTPDDGFFTLLPVTVWLPLDKYNPWWSILLYGVMWLGSTLSVGIVISHNLFFLTSCEDVSVGLRTLGIALRHLKRRAELLPASQRPLALAHSVRHHQVIIRVVNNIEDIVYYPAWIFVGGSTILICMSAFLFLNENVALMAKVVFAFFLMAELLGVLIYCYYGEQIKTASGELREEMYGCQWEEASGALKNGVLIVQARTAQPLVISAGGFMTLSLETYGNVLSTAFSYFNLMNAVN